MSHGRSERFAHSPRGPELCIAGCTRGTKSLVVEHCVCAVPLPTAPNTAPYCTANVQPGVTWSNGDGTYSGIMNVVSTLLICGLLSEPTPAIAS